MSCANINKKPRRSFGFAWAVGLVSWLVAPTVVHAGLGDFFGIAGAVTAVSDVTWKIYAVKTIAAMGPLILLVIAIIGTIVAAWAIVHIGNSFSETLRTTMRDEKVTKAEWGIILIQASYTVPVIILLGFLTLNLGSMVYHSWHTMQNFSPPPVEQAPVITKLRKT